jgi:hypothetical protein
MYTCDTADLRIFCAGEDDSFSSRVFERDYDRIRRNAFDGDAPP